MKKKVKLLAVAAVSCAIVSGLTACTEHAHTADEVWHGDENNHWHVCVEDGEILEETKAAHTDADALEHDGTKHWHVCDGCELKYGEAAHTADTEWHTDGTDRWHVCTECGAVVESTKVAIEKVTLPEYNLTATYTGEALSCGLSSTDKYTVAYAQNGETVTPVAAGAYNVTVALTDKTYTKWADGTTDDKTFTFTVEKKNVTAPTADETAFKCTGEEQTYGIAESSDYTIENNKRTEAGTQTVTVKLADADNTQWADGTTTDLTFTFTIEHDYGWTNKDGEAVYECAGHDGDSKTLKLSVEKRKDLVLNMDEESEKSTAAVELDLSSIGEYASVEKIMLGETVLSEDNTLAIPAGLGFTKFGEQNMIVTVKTADGASHEITVPVLLVTEEISTFDRLVECVQIINAKCGKFNEGKYFTLAGNITLDDDTPYNVFGINGGNGLATAGSGNGFAGTLDGKGFSIVGGYTAGGGLFGSLQNAVVKNIHFENVNAKKNATVSVITGSMYDSVLDNVKVTVKGSVDFGTSGNGIVASNRVINITLNKVTVNAENCSFATIFGTGWANPTAKIDCTEVTVNVKSLGYATADSNNGSAKPQLAIDEVSGMKVSMEASVAPEERLSLIKNEFALNLGDKFAAATKIEKAFYNGAQIEVADWTIENGVLSGDSTIFALSEVGSIKFVIVIQNKNITYTLTVEAVVESGYEKIALTDSVDVILVNNGTDNTEIAVNLGETYAGYTITDAILGTNKLSVLSGKIVVNDALKGMKTGETKLTVQANNGENYYEFSMPAVLVSESVTSFDRLVALVQISDAKCGKLNEGKYFILGDDITLEAGKEYNTQVKPDGTPAYGYAGAGSGNGFAGTLDGRKHSIIGGKMAAGGLFGSLQSATVKDINFTDVQAVNGAPISVITGSMYDSKLENITVTVKGNVNVKGWNDGTESVGIISSNRVVNITLNNVTVNATGCSFETVFGKGYGNVGAKISCTNVVINVKALDYITTNSNNTDVLAVGDVENITVNLTQE